jgi:predicted DNA repair protein MutK
MFLVGGGILMHGMPGGHTITHAVEAVAGALALGAVTLFGRLRGKGKDQAGV